MVDLILDKAGQKGTGKWTVTSALDLGVPLTLIGESVFARCLSAQKDERVAAEKILKGPKPKFDGDPKAFIDDVEMALYASKIISYAQGYALMNAMAKDSGWEINNGGVALMWRGGCIIRSAFLGKIKEAFDRDPKLANLLLDPYFTGEIDRAQAGWRRVIAAAAIQGIPAPGHVVGPGLLRRLPMRPAARQPAPGPARLLRRPHLRDSPPTSSRPSATSSGPTPTSGSTSPAASSSTPTGPAGAAPRPRRPTTPDDRRSSDDRAIASIGDPDLPIRDQSRARGSSRRRLSAKSPRSSRRFHRRSWARRSRTSRRRSSE